MTTEPRSSLSRRRFLGAAVAAGALALPSPLRRGPFAQTSDRARPGVPYGVQSGEVSDHEAVIWSATDRPARMIVEYATTDRFTDVRRRVGPAALPETGFAAKVPLDDLPAGQDVFYRVMFQDLGDRRTLSVPVTGRLRTAAPVGRDVSFVWTGDTAGQGWGISPDWGGMKLYDAMRRTQPDFLVHSGDMIYADNPIVAEVKLPSGALWKNLVTAHVRAMNAEVTQYVQWDDHEVTNNWFPARILEDSRYTVKSCALLAARAKRAMFDFTLLVGNPLEAERVYRTVRRGPLLDVFMLDMRTYRGDNNENVQTTLTDDARILGRAQVDWLKRELLASRATWKVIAADMPLGLVVRHDAAKNWGSEAVAQGDGPALGRELEIADLLRFIKHNGIVNVIWITADVHYCATHLYDPTRAQFQDFAPFYEFVSGPAHAGGFGPNPLDNTFGPQVIFTKNPGGKANTDPTLGGLYFGHVRIDGKTRAMTVTHHDLTGAVLHRLELPAAV